MWKSEDDVLRDIVSLSDFGDPDDKESCKILYSVGRGLKTKEKPKTSEKFIDSRTGEVINLEDPILDASNVSYKTKGRGSLVGSLFRTKLQLQQQLRLARPLGSGDGAIESYYRRSRSQENDSNSINKPDFEYVDQSTKITSENNNRNSDSNKTRKRVIATRNSSLQVNALINSLLSKHKEEDSDATKYEHSSSSNSEKYNRNYKCDKVQSDSDFSDSTLSSTWNKTSIENVNNCKEETSKLLQKKYLGDENFKVIDDDESEEEDKRETNNLDEDLGKVKNNLKVPESDRDLKHKALEDRLKSLKLSCYTKRNESDDSTSFYEHTNPTEKVILIDEDFPPLPKI